MAGRKGWTITGVDEQVRAEAVAAAERAGMPVHAWIEQAGREGLHPQPDPPPPGGGGVDEPQAVREALDPEPDPAPPEGVEIDELEAMVRRVMAEELRPVREALGRLEALAAVPGPAGRGPVTLTRERMRHRRSR